MKISFAFCGRLELKDNFSSIACKCLFIPLQVMFHFRLSLGEKYTLNYRFCVTCQFETSLVTLKSI